MKNENLTKKGVGIIWIIILVMHNSFARINCHGDKFYSKGQKFEHQNLDSAIFYYKLALRDFIRCTIIGGQQKALTQLYWQYYQHGDFEKAGVYLEKNINLHNKNTFEKDLHYANYLETIASKLQLEGNLSKAQYYYKKAIAMKEDIVVKQSDLVHSYFNLALLYFSLGEFKLGLELLEKTILIIEEEPNNDLGELDLAYILNTYATYLNHLKKENAFSFFKKAEKIYDSLKSNEYVAGDKLDFYASFIPCLIKRKDFNEINKIIDKANDLIRSYPDAPYKFYYYNSLGKAFAEKKELNLARQYFTKSKIDVLAQHKEIEKYFITAMHIYDLAKFEFLHGDIIAAKQEVQEALIKLSFDYYNSNLFSNPAVGKIIKNIESLKILTLKAQILQALYQSSNNVKELQAAYDTYQLAADLAKLIRQDIMTQGSKQKLAGEVLPIYEGGIETALALYKLTQKDQYKNMAFQYAESNKAILLLESMNDNDAKNYSNIPDSLLEKENELKIEITFYEKKINQKRSKKENIDEEKIKNWESILFDLNTKYQALITLLEEQYPKYYELKHNTKLTTPQALQYELFNSSDALIEYFVGEKNIYAFIISKNDFLITTIQKPKNFQEDIDLFLYHIKRPGKTDTDFRLSLEMQHDYYLKYLQPAIHLLPSSISRLIIIPDDKFNYIPFELLITSPIPAEETRFSPKEHDYLFERYIMTYDYSATLLQKSYEQKKKRKAKNILLAMAPNFNKNTIASHQHQERACTIFDIYDLACSDKEVQEIAALMGGDYFIGQDADKATFEKIAKDYRILHLATHSCPDEEDPNFSKIFLADEAITNYDLFNYEFNADLAVLSACNTGFGKLVKGEGIMPLSKGFIQAGIPSTVMSLWPVDDCGTSRMMKLLYYYLDEGFSKDEALQKAKLDFVQNANAVYQHPYYWSAFIHMGNFEPIHEKSGIPPVVWWITGGLAILGLFGVSRKRRKQAA